MMVAIHWSSVFPLFLESTSNGTLVRLFFPVSCRGSDERCLRPPSRWPVTGWLGRKAVVLVNSKLAISGIRDFMVMEWKDSISKDDVNKRRRELIITRCKDQVESLCSFYS